VYDSNGELERTNDFVAEKMPAPIREFFDMEKLVFD
jgi:hypothetical protein